MAKQLESDIMSTAQSILRYLATRPEASETVQGVAKWWLLLQRYEDSLDHVQHALDFLEERGEVKKQQLTDGTLLYRKSLQETLSINAH